MTIDFENEDIYDDTKNISDNAKEIAKNDWINERNYTQEIEDQISCGHFHPNTTVQFAPAPFRILDPIKYIHVPLWINNLDFNNPNIPDLKVIFAFVDSIITKGDLPVGEDDFGICAWKDKDNIRVMHWMSMLKKWIPIFLVDPDRMPTGEEMEALGCYFPTSIFKSPVIFLCPQKIQKCAEEKNIDLNLLYAIVMIHELAHAVLDKANVNIDRVTDDCYSCPKYKESSSYQKSEDEEAWANFLMLKYIERWARGALAKKLEETKIFVRSQTGKYQLGGVWFENNKPCNWQEYRDKKTKRNQNE